MYACMHACMHVCAYVHMYVCTYIYIYYIYNECIDLIYMCKYTDCLRICANRIPSLGLCTDVDGRYLQTSLAPTEFQAFAAHALVASRLCLRFSSTSQSETEAGLGLRA